MSDEFSNTVSHCQFRAESSVPPESIAADCLVVFVTEGAVTSGAAAEIDRATGGLLSTLSASGEITGKKYECVPLLVAPGIAARQLLVIGLGPRSGLDCGTLYRAAATATRHLSTRPRETVVLLADGAWTTRQVEQAVAGSKASLARKLVRLAEVVGARDGTPA